MGHIIEIMSMAKIPDGNSFGITKLDRDRYLVNDTGEICFYDHTEKRVDNLDNIRKTFKKLRHLINYNFRGQSNELAFTITYNRHVTDPNVLYIDFKKFMMRLRYRYKDIDYLNVVEPQGSGRWHCHILLRFNSMKNIFIANKVVADMWGNGFVSVKAIRKDVDNIGAYLSAYLGDVEVTDENIINNYQASQKLDIKEVEIEGVKKQFIKGGRLHYYPTGMRIYRKSKGIREPPSEWLYFEEVRKIVGTATPNYSKTVDILDENDECLNSITYYQYNLKR